MCAYRSGSPDKASRPPYKEAICGIIAEAALSCHQLDQCSCQGSHGEFLSLQDGLKNLGRRRFLLMNLVLLLDKEVHVGPGPV